MFFGSDPTDLNQIGPDTLIVGDDGLSGREIYRLEEVVPQVDSPLIEIDDNTAQRSFIQTFSLTFNSIVEITGDAFQFQNLTTGDFVDDVPVVSELGGRTIVNFTFTPGNSVNANGLLRNGDYQLTVDATMISSLGTLLDGDGDGTSGDDFLFGDVPADQFFRKFADNNGNNIVDFLDLTEFLRAFGHSVGEDDYNRVFDDNGDGTVAFFPDLNEFLRGFGT